MVVYKKKKKKKQWTVADKVSLWANYFLELSQKEWSLRCSSHGQCFFFFFLSLPEGQLSIGALSRGEHLPSDHFGLYLALYCMCIPMITVQSDTQEVMTHSPELMYWNFFINHNWLLITD